VKDFLKGTGLSTTKDTEYYVNYGYCEDIAAVEDAAQVLNKNFNKNGVKVDVIDNNNDGDVDYILYTVETLSEVVRYNTKNESITVRAMNGNKAMSFDDVVFADDVAEDDLVLFVEYGGRAYISIPETLTGEITRVDRDKASELYVTIDGETYKQSYIPNEVNNSDVNKFDISKVKDGKPGFDKATFIFDSNGYIVAYTEPAAAAANYALVLGSAWSQNALTKEGQIKVRLTDNTVETYPINWSASQGSSKKAFATESDLEAYLGTRDVVVDEKTPLNNAAGTVITYSINDDGELTIKDVLTLNNNTTSKYDDIAVIDSAKDKGTGTKVLDKNLERFVSTKYDRDDGRLYTKTEDGGSVKTYAIDLDTVAFYYDVDAEGKAHSAAAVGYDAMYDVAVGKADNKNVQVYTGKDGRLVTVVLFNAQVDDTAYDYLYVLSRNAIKKDTIVLNVAFQDGTVASIEVDKDDYLSEFAKDNDFDHIWKYGVKKDGTYYLDEPEADTVIDDMYAHLITNKTIVINKVAEKWTDEAEKVEDKNWDVPVVIGSEKSYFTIKNSVIWDITDITSAADTDKCAEGKFDYDYAHHIAGIWNSDKNAIEVAWIWSQDPDAVDDDADDSELNVKDVYLESNWINATVTEKVDSANVKFDVYVKVDGEWELLQKDLAAKFGDDGNPRYYAQCTKISDKTNVYRVVVKDGKEVVSISENLLILE